MSITAPPRPCGTSHTLHVANHPCLRPDAEDKHKHVGRGVGGKGALGAGALEGDQKASGRAQPCSLQLYLTGPATLPAAGPPACPARWQRGDTAEADLLGGSPGPAWCGQRCLCANVCAGQPCQGSHRHALHGPVLAASLALPSSTPAAPARRPLPVQLQAGSAPGPGSGQCSLRERGALRPRETPRPGMRPQTSQPAASTAERGPSGCGAMSCSQPLASAP